MLAYGIPLRYYVDSLRVFRFVQQRGIAFGESMSFKLTKLTLNGGR